MPVKCVAIGNSIMGDDGIGLKVTKELSEKLINDGIEVIFGETDSYYAFDKIEEGDFLFILDATYFQLSPGSVTFTPIYDIAAKKDKNYSAHQLGLIDLLCIYRKKVDGYVIGIEIGNIDICMELSDILKNRFNKICGEIYEFIYSTISQSRT